MNVKFKDIDGLKKKLSEKLEQKKNKKIMSSFIVNYSTLFKCIIKNYKIKIINTYNSFLTNIEIGKELHVDVPKSCKSPFINKNGFDIVIGIDDPIKKSELLRLIDKQNNILKKFLIKNTIENNQNIIVKEVVNLTKKNYNIELDSTKDINNKIREIINLLKSNLINIYNAFKKIHLNYINITKNIYIKWHKINSEFNTLENEKERVQLRYLAMELVKNMLDSILMQIQKSEELVFENISNSILKKYDDIRNIIDSSESKLKKNNNNINVYINKLKENAIVFSQFVEWKKKLDYNMDIFKNWDINKLELEMFTN